MIFGIFYLQFFADCQQEDADDDNGNKNVSLPGQLFLQEDTGQQQGHNTNRGENGGCDSVNTAKSIYIGELAGRFKNCGEDFILVLGQGTKLNLLSDFAFLR